MLFIITDLTYDCNFRLQSLLEKCLFLVQLQRCNFDFLDPIQDFYKIQFSNCQSNNYIKHFHIFFLASHQDTFLLHQITTRLLLYTANHWYMQAAMVANVQVVKVLHKQVPWWWSECSPSTWTIRVRIPLNSTIFLYNLYLIGTKINKKEARDGPFLNGIASPYPTLHCLLGKNLILNLKYLISKNNLKIFFPSFSFRILRIRS